MDRNKIVSCSVVALTAALISVSVLFAPASAGVSPDVGRAIGDETNGTVAIIGETNLTFVDANGTLIPSGKLKGTWEDSKPIRFPNKGYVFDSSKEDLKDKLVEGEYNVIGDNGRNTTIDFYSPILNIKTKVCSEEFSWVIKGDNITFEADTNLNEINGTLPNNITYKLIGPDGVQLHTVGNVSLSNIPVDYGGKNTTSPINTTNLEFGTYTLSIETDPATNNGLDVEGPSVTFEVRSKGVTIEAKPEEQTVTEDIVFSITTTPYANITLNVTWGMESKAWFKEDVGNVKKGGHSASGVADENGDFKAVAYFTGTGAFEITATERGCSKENITRNATTDSAWVKVTPLEASVATDKDIYHIGENVEITGSAEAGDYVMIKVDNEVIGNEPLSNSKFSHTWRTTEEETPGSHKIAIWVKPSSDPETDPPDASVTIVLLRGGLFAEPSSDFVALGDDFTIKGTAPGRERVDILTIAPEGGSGNGFDPVDIKTKSNGKLKAPGLTYSTCGLDTDGTFETEKIKVGKKVYGKKVDTGTYLIAVLNYGRDKVWGNTYCDDLLAVIGNKYLFTIDAKFEDELNRGIISEELKNMFKTKGFSLSENATVRKEKDKWVITDKEKEKIYIIKEGGKLNIYRDNYSTNLGIKTTDQILAILKARTINAAGSDDLLGIATIKVEEGFVTLDPIEDVPLGKKIEVTGTTNRKTGTSLIITVEGMYANATKLKPKFATVEADDRNFYNKFAVSFDTATAKIGKYEVTADDGDGHVATTMVNILPAEEPSVNVSAATPSPITTTTNESTNTTPALTKPMMIPTPATATTSEIQTATEKQPGFEMVFSIAGLLVATWLILILRQRNKKK